MKKVINFCFLTALSWLLILHSSASAITVPKTSGARITGVWYQVDNGQTMANLAEQHWQPYAAYRLPGGVKNLWLKIDINTTTPDSNGVFISLLASHQAYWDNQWLGGSGIIGTDSATEQPGYLDTIYRIPDTLLAPGQHTLILQLSRHHIIPLRNSNFVDVAIAPYEHIVNKQLFTGMLPFFLLGALLVVALFTFSLSLGTRHYRHFFAFGLLCLLVASLMAVESWRPIFSYPYNWHVPRLVCVALLTLAISWLLPWLIWTEFAVQQKHFKALLLLVSYVVMLLAIPSFDFSALLMVITALLISAASIINCKATKQAEDWLLLVSLAICLGLALSLDEFMESWFFISFGLLMIAILHKLAQQLKAVQQQFYQHQLSNEQLKLSLLKSHIKPHFLMNTLTSLAEWIELAPNTAQTLIDALAEEFRLLSEIVDKPLIALDEELHLCQLHLQIMSLRQDRQYTMTIQHNGEALMIPPGILHTLIENVISHQQAPSGRVITINLNITVDTSDVTILISCPFQQQISSTGIGTGTGFRYIYGRLHNVFNDRFVFEQYQHGAQWIAKIVFPRQASQDHQK